MSSDYTPSSGRRSSRRGGRRPDRQRGGSRSNRQENTPPPAPKKLTFWQKIAAFFGAKPAAPASRSNGYGSIPRETSARAERPERKERQERSERPQRAERPARADRPSGFRAPEIVEVTSPRLYVGNLSFDAAESDLFELFNGIGLVQNVEIVANKHTQKSKGFAFVQMQTVDEAKRAVAELHDKEYMGRKLVVSGAKAVEEKRSERRQAEAPTETQPEAESAPQPEAQQQQQPEQ
jgi:RNA recognition motif-containing protein